ncbi:hypothetical protein ACR6C2_02275 [Streptomyces sp. INA 01156]
MAPRGEQLSFYRGSGPYATPRALDARELADIRRGFADAARRARAAGFDGVEVHGANGYLLDQFLTDYLNRREDGYGGSVENRVRLAAEVVDEVLQAVGSEIAVGIRISQSKVSDFHHRWQAAPRRPRSSSPPWPAPARTSCTPPSTRRSSPPSPPVRKPWPSSRRSSADCR